MHAVDAPFEFLGGTKADDHPPWLPRQAREKLLDLHPVHVGAGAVDDEPIKLLGVVGCDLLKVKEIDVPPHLVLQAVLQPDDLVFTYSSDRNTRFGQYAELGHPQLPCVLKPRTLCLKITPSQLCADASATVP